MDSLRFFIVGTHRQVTPFLPLDNENRGVSTQLWELSQFHHALVLGSCLRRPGERRVRGVQSSREINFRNDYVLLPLH